MGLDEVDWLVGTSVPDEDVPVLAAGCEVVFERAFFDADCVAFVADVIVDLLLFLEVKQGHHLSRADQGKGSLLRLEIANWPIEMFKFFLEYGFVLGIEHENLVVLIGDY